MRTWIQILTMCLLLLIPMGVNGADTTLPSGGQPLAGEIHPHKDSTGRPHEAGPVLCAPAQAFTVTLNPGDGTVAHAKYRTTLTRCNLSRRALNRLFINRYAPLSQFGPRLVERMTAPLRSMTAVGYHVIKLCRLLC